MKKLLIGILSLLVFTTQGFTLTIEGTGDSQELLRGLSKLYYETTKIKVSIPNSVGSGGGIKKVIKGECKLARVARPLKEKEKNKGLSYILFAYSPIVFVANVDRKGPLDISSNQIVNIFKGEIKTWDKLQKNGLKGKIYIINREVGDSSRNILDKTLKGFSHIEKFAGVIANYNSEAKDLLTKYKNTIGYLSMPNTIDTNLKIISVDGVHPSLQNIRDKRYNYLTPFSFVYKKTLTPEAKSFIEFLKTDKAKTFMIQNGVVPVL